MVRVPYGRLEFRLPDAGCNPYLVHAALIAAGLDGIDRQLDPGKAQNINLYELTPEQCREQNIDILPQSLSEAVDALEADSVLREGLGEAITDEFIKVKREEWAEYSSQVSDWEIQRYAEFF